MFPLLLKEEDQLNNHWQPKLLRSLPSVQNVCFPRSAAMADMYQQQSQWVEENELINQVLWLSSGSTCPLDLYHLLKASHMKPTTLDVGHTRNYLAYKPDGGIPNLTAETVADDAQDDSHDTAGGGLYRRH